MHTLEAISNLALLGPLGWPEILALGILGVLLFGRRLPEVGKNIGKGIVEFKKGLSGIEDDVNETNNNQPENQQRLSEPNGGQTLDLGSGADKAESGNPQKEQNGGSA